MRMFDVIAKKRDGKELTKEEIGYFVSGYTAGEIPDYQAAALLMAAYLKGLTFEETVCLTECIVHSGETMDLNGISGVKADKHSTGGVGDGVSLAVAPIVAACGVKVAMISGRGLGHTGGTLDKLESIQGYNCYLSRDRFLETVDQVGCSIIGQTDSLAPADKKLYALRDVTATVDKQELIAASIMGKKLAEGIDCLVLDVKTGSGAFMKSPENARSLAELMVKIARAHGKKATALITDMDAPLGNAVGNSVEVIEAIECLNGRAPADYTALTTELAAETLRLSGKCGGDIKACREECKKAVTSGAAKRKFREMVAAHGGRAEWVDDPSLFPKAKYRQDVLARENGYIRRIDTEKYGIASLLLGAGRAKKEDSIDPSAGILILAKTGDKVTAGEPIATLLASDPRLFAAAGKLLEESVSYSSVAPKSRPLIFDTIH